MKGNEANEFVYNTNPADQQRLTEFFKLMDDELRKAGAHPDEMEQRQKSAFQRANERRFLFYKKYYENQQRRR